jgi:hypothetical protein
MISEDDKLEIQKIALEMKNALVLIPVSEQIKKNASYLEDYQVVEACQEYGISYDGVDADKMRLLMLLKGAEKLLTDNTIPRPL